MVEPQVAQAIQERRRMCDNEPKELFEKRMKWERDLRIHFNYDDLKLFEMYRFVEFGTKKTKEEYPQFNSQSKYFNTRINLISENSFETDISDKEKAMNIICEVCLALMRNDYHFVIFYAEGQRSPHIRIYDFEQLRDLNTFNREIARKEFWKQLVPMLWKSCDQSIWCDDHPLQLEFALHWKYGTPFNLIYEHLPEPKVEEQKTLFKKEKKVWKKKTYWEYIEDVKNKYNYKVIQCN